jgi:hypothetical protein
MFHRVTYLPKGPQRALQYVTEEQRSQPGWIGREGDRLSHSRARALSLGTK